MARSKSGKKGDGRPWRENIEAITVSVIVIVLFKYFVLEAYKIPTGSMQPTLMGWSDGKSVGGSPHFWGFFFSASRVTRRLPGSPPHVRRGPPNMARI